MSTRRSKNSLAVATVALVAPSSSFAGDPTGLTDPTPDTDLSGDPAESGDVSILAENDSVLVEGHDIDAD